MQESYRLAAQVKPDLVLGTDPDCDRCAVAVPENGAFRKLSGNELGCLLLDYILGTLAEKNALPCDPVAVRSIVSTPMADKIAAKYGVHSADMLLPLQSMTGFGRTMSPVTGGIVAVAGIAGVSPFHVVKRNFVPLLACCVVNFVVTFLFIFP